jgi:hypothetical protein
LKGERIRREEDIGFGDSDVFEVDDRFFHIDKFLPKMITQRDRRKIPQRFHSLNSISCNKKFIRFFTILSDIFLIKKIGYLGSAAGLGD